MMAGQYVVCWTADPDDQAPTGKSSLVKYMTMVPSVVKTIYQNARLRIPCSPTQRWYYCEGSEDKDCEYGKIWVAVASPLANVTAGSATSLMLRLRWTIEFQMPALPPESSPEGNTIYASAPNYFTDSSSDWKSGKFLTFKWHEGGNIVGFPGGEPKKPYQCDVDVGYYVSNGTLKVSRWAVCVTEVTEDNQPMLALCESKEKAEAWCKAPADTYLLPYYAAGPWVPNENPPWYERSVTLDLLLSRKTTLKVSSAPDATLKVSDDASLRTFNVVKRLVGNARNPGELSAALAQLSKLSFSAQTVGADLLNVFNWDPVRAQGPSTSSFEEVDLSE